MSLNIVSLSARNGRESPGERTKLGPGRARYLCTCYSLSTTSNNSFVYAGRVAWSVNHTG
jgi:hypothetical protein